MWTMGVFDSWNNKCKRECILAPAGKKSLIKKFKLARHTAVSLLHSLEAVEIKINECALWANNL